MVNCVGFHLTVLLTRLTLLTRLFLWISMEKT